VLEALMGPGAVELAACFKDLSPTASEGDRSAPGEPVFPGSLGLTVSRRYLQALGAQIGFELDEAQEGRLVVEGPLSMGQGSKAGAPTLTAPLAAGERQREGVDVPVR
jgi:hypothetical protein